MLDGTTRSIKEATEGSRYKREAGNQELLKPIKAAGKHVRAGSEARQQVSDTIKPEMRPVLKEIRNHNLLIQLIIFSFIKQH